MSTVTIKPKAENRPVLEGGQYGPGLQNDAKVELTEFEAPDENGMLERMPAYDRDGERGPYCRFNVKVEYNGSTFFVTDWREFTNRLKNDLRNCGVDVIDQTDGTFTFDDAQVAPGGGRELGGIDLKAPRQAKDDPERRYPGGIKGFISK